MIIAFLDLLGFTNLLRTDVTQANLNYQYFKRTLNTIIDDFQTVQNNNPLKELEIYNKNTSLSAMDYLVTISDSIILGSGKPDDFIVQVSNLIAKMYIQSTTEYSYLKTSAAFGISPNDFPLLFRGGVSFGEDVMFERLFSIFDKEKCKSTDVIGMPYLQAYKLETSGKGPRLFCDNSVIRVLSDDIKKCIRRVSTNPEIFEIVWTAFACEAMGCSDNLWQNVRDSINKKLLPASINLYLKNCKNSESIFVHYRELLYLVCNGIIRYADIKCGKANEAAQTISRVLLEYGIPNEDILYDYIC